MGVIASFFPRCCQSPRKAGPSMEASTRTRPAGADGLVEQVVPEDLVARAQAEHSLHGRALERAPVVEQDVEVVVAGEKRLEVRAQAEPQPLDGIARRFHRPPPGLQYPV